MAIHQLENIENRLSGKNQYHSTKIHHLEKMVARSARMSSPDPHLATQRLGEASCTISEVWAKVENREFVYD